MLLNALWLGAVLLQVAASQSPARNLAEYEGQYEYRDGASLLIVASRDRLVAIIDEAKYPLQPAGTDTFRNVVGDRIPFIRDTNGRVLAFQENGDSFKRLSPSVPPAARLLLEPRPKIDGRTIAYHYREPPALPDGIRTGAAPGQLRRRVAEQLVDGVIDGVYPDVRSILLYQSGALWLEEYFYGYDRERPHQMRSLTKSVISLLAGVAVDRGLIRADEPVLARLGYATYENPDPRKAKVTLTNLLSNQSGLACNDHDSASPGNEVKLYETPDWPKAFVDLPMAADPGTVGRYCSGGFLTAGRVIERAAGKPLPEFAQEALFDKLGIPRANWRWDFKLNRSHRSDFGQIYLRPRDMLKLGILIQQRGQWQGRRVVSASWIEAAVAVQSHVDDSDYGLGIWHRWYGVRTQAGERRVDTIMLSGNGGQKVYLVPSLDLIAVFTGGSFNRESPVNEMMVRILLPALLAQKPAGERRPNRL